MTQSKQEVADRNAKIRAEKLRENLARRKQQTRQRVLDQQPGDRPESGKTAETTEENSVG
jgi:hypothetical protein